MVYLVGVDSEWIEKEQPSVFVVRSEARGGDRALFSLTPVCLSSSKASGDADPRGSTSFTISCTGLHLLHNSASQL